MGAKLGNSAATSRSASSSVHRRSSQPGCRSAHACRAAAHLSGTTCRHEFSLSAEL